MLETDQRGFWGSVVSEDIGDNMFILYWRNVEIVCLSWKTKSISHNPKINGL